MLSEKAAVGVEADEAVATQSDSPNAGAGTVPHYTRAQESRVVRKLDLNLVSIS
jgi:hypothetical protein